MNVTVLKTWWFASWEVQVTMIATLLAGLTAIDLVPVLAFLPDTMATIVGTYFPYVIIIATFVLRVFKTKSQMVLNRSDATPKEEKKAVIAASKT